jgi:hypothetical protein
MIYLISSFGWDQSFLICCEYSQRWERDHSFVTPILLRRGKCLDWVHHTVPFADWISWGNGGSISKQFIGLSRRGRRADSNEIPLKSYWHILREKSRVESCRERKLQSMKDPSDQEIDFQSVRLWHAADPDLELENFMRGQNNAVRSRFGG